MPELRTLKQAMRILERLDAARKANDQKKARRLSLRISHAMIEKRWPAEVAIVVNLDHAETQTKNTASYAPKGPCHV